jgi:hypothetical protein
MKERVASSPEAIKKRLIAKGAVFPILGRDAIKLRGVGPSTIETLRRNGLLLPDFLEGLSTRAVNCLCNMNISSKEETRKAIDELVLFPGKIRNCGKKTYMEICGWALD